MNKLYRFMKEFANYQINQIKGSDRSEYEKDILIVMVNRYVMDYRKGYLTVGDAMGCLAELDSMIRYGIDR